MPITLQNIIFNTNYTSVVPNGGFVRNVTEKSPVIQPSLTPSAIPSISTISPATPAKSESVKSEKKKSRFDSLLENLF